MGNEKYTRFSHTRQRNYNYVDTHTNKKHGRARSPPNGEGDILHSYIVCFNGWSVYAARAFSLTATTRCPGRACCDTPCPRFVPDHRTEAKRFVRIPSGDVVKAVALLLGDSVSARPPAKKNKTTTTRVRPSREKRAPKPVNRLGASAKHHTQPTHPQKTAQNVVASTFFVLTKQKKRKQQYKM